MEIDLKKFDVEKFDSILARGLSTGLGKRGEQVCIEAAICETLGLEHSDDPECVSAAVRSFKIRLNDSRWSSPIARANGLRDLGLAQLGSLGIVNDKEFAKRLAEKTIRILVPALIRDLFPNDPKLLEAADRCEKEGNESAANAAAAAYAAYAANANAAAAAYANAANAAPAANAAYAANPTPPPAPPPPAAATAAPSNAAYAANAAAAAAAYANAAAAYANAAAD